MTANERNLSVAVVHRCFSVGGNSIGKLCEWFIELKSAIDA